MWHSVWTDGHPGWSNHGTEQSDNAQMIAEALAGSSIGITKNAASGIIGNMTRESFLNPGQWEMGYNMAPSSGFGLGQWTPSTKFSNWLGSTNPVNMQQGDKQIEFLLLNNPNQWSSYYVDMNTGYSSYYDVYVPILPTITDYFLSNATVAELATAWMVYWERPGSGGAGTQLRIDEAEYWFDHIDYVAHAPIWLIAKASQNWRQL